MSKRLFRETFVNAPSGDVSKSLQNLLNNATAREYFRLFLREEFSLELLRFWEQTEDFRRSRSKGKNLYLEGMVLWKKYFEGGADFQLQLPPAIKVHCLPFSRPKSPDHCRLTYLLCSKRQTRQRKSHRMHLRPRSSTSITSWRQTATLAFCFPSTFSSAKRI